MNATAPRGRPENSLREFSGPEASATPSNKEEFVL